MLFAMSVPGIPTHLDLMWPTFIALQELGGSGTIKEIEDRVIADEGYSKEIVEHATKDGSKSELLYRLHWARTYLKLAGVITNSSRGVWTLVDWSKATSPEELVTLGRTAAKASRKQTSKKHKDEASHDEEVDENSWKDALLATMQSLSPSGFERLAQRLLREAGFVNVSVLGKSGDGGIDGMGVYRLSLVSFPVYFQCKRYQGVVGPSVVRDFRGAMTGRGEKGLLITTGSFTRDAALEATRDGAPPVELIDGDHLCDLLVQYQLGVITMERIEYDHRVDDAFFAEFR